MDDHEVEAGVLAADGSWAAAVRIYLEMRLTK